MSGIKPMTPVDAKNFIINIVKQRLGESQLATLDTSNMVSVADMAYQVGLDTIIKDIYTLVGRQINKVRSYDSKRYASVLTDDAGWENRIAVVKFYSDDVDNAGDRNTDVKPNNIVNGANPESDGRSQWTMKFSPVLEYFFDGGNAWSYQLPTVTDTAWMGYLRNPAEFASFFNGMMTEALNALADTKEAMAQAVVLNHIAGVYQMVQDGDMGQESVVDLTALYNKKMGTSLTRTQILTEHLDDFLKIYASKIKTDSNRLARRSIKYHWNPTKVVDGKNYYLKQHTPKDAQRGIFYGQLINEAFTRVLPTIFNAGLLKGSVDSATAGFEMIDSWQALDTGDDYDGAKIDVEVAIPTAQTKKAVALDFVLGMIYDEQAIKVLNKFEKVRTTAFHAVSGAQNSFYSFFKGAIDDFTDNTIIYIMTETGSPIEPETQVDTFASSDVTNKTVTLTKPAASITKVELIDLVDPTPVEVPADGYTFDATTNTVEIDSYTDEMVKVTYIVAAD